MNNLLYEQILPLSIPEKLQLIENIWDSIVASAEKIPLTHAQKQELDLEEAYQWYEVQANQLGSEFIDSLLLRWMNNKVLFPKIYYH